MLPGPGSRVPITPEINPAVQIPGAMGPRNAVAAAKTGSECPGLWSPTASTNSAISSSDTTRESSAESPTDSSSIARPIIEPPFPRRAARRPPRDPPAPPRRCPPPPRAARRGAPLVTRQGLEEIVHSRHQRAQPVLQPLDAIFEVHHLARDPYHLSAGGNAERLEGG